MEPIYNDDQNMLKMLKLKGMRFFKEFTFNRLSKEERDILSNYFKLYIDSGLAPFWNNCSICDIYNYAKVDKKLVSMLINSFTENYTDEDIAILLNDIINHDENKTIHIYEILLKNDAILNLVSQDENLSLMIIDDIFKILPYNNDYDVLEYLMKHDKLKDYILYYIADKFNSNINLIHNGIFENKETSLLIKILNFMLLAFFSNDICDNIDFQNINGNYIIDKCCNINWYSKTIESEEIYNMTTILFFLILNSVRILVKPLEEKYFQEEKRLTHSVLRVFESNSILKAECSRLKNMILSLNNGLLDKFNKHVVTWITNKNLPYEIDSILNLIKMNNSCIWEWIICGSCTNSIDLKLNMLSRILSYNIDKDDVILNLPSDKLSDNIIKIHNSLELVDEPKINNIDRYNTIYNFIQYYSENIILLNNINSKKFLNIIFDNLYDNLKYYEILLNFMRKEYGYEYDQESLAHIKFYCMMKSCSPQELLSKLLSHVVSISYILNIMHTKDVMDNLIVKEGIMYNQFIQGYNILCQIVNITLDTEEDLCPLVLNNMYIITNNVVDVLYNYLHPEDNKEFAKTFYKDLELNKHYFNVISELDDSRATEILNPPQDIILANEEPEIEYPDEFLDPLVCTVIKDPVLLPNMKEDVFIDKSTIIRQLLNKEENPFTREKLTIEELEEYNNKEDIQEKIHSFITRLKEYK